jgi:hypothetical protein
MAKGVGILLLALLFSANAHANEVVPKTHEEVKKQFMYDCLSTGRTKYELFERCIGRLYEDCFSPQGIAYEKVIEEKRLMSGGRYECMDLESIYWDELFSEYSQKLKQRKYARDGMQQILDKKLTEMSQRPNCEYVAARWQPKDNGENAPITLEEEFGCNLEHSAERAIILYLWDRHAEVITNCC